jgi:hypothetical protein
MRSAFGLILLVFSLFSCDHTTEPSAAGNDGVIFDSLYKSDNPLHRVQEATWIKLNARLLMFPKMVTLFDADQKMCRDYQSSRFEEVELIRRTSNMMFDSAAEDSCHRSYFLEIKMDNRIYQTKGSHFYLFDDVPVAYLFWKNKYWAIETLDFLYNSIYSPKDEIACYGDERWFTIRNIDSGIAWVACPQRMMSIIKSKSVDGHNKLSTDNSSDTLKIPCSFPSRHGVENGVLEIAEREGKLTLYYSERDGQDSIDIE